MTIILRENSVALSNARTVEQIGLCRLVYHVEYYPQFVLIGYLCPSLVSCVCTTVGVWY